MVLPFTVVGQGVDAADSGLYMGKHFWRKKCSLVYTSIGALNIFVVLPQLLVAVSGGFLVELCNNNISSAMAAGGVASIIGTYIFCATLVTL
jgi:membrane protein DedA with SNARE-associated domain